jgi:serine phosphatase RsbU (regulator of sigma subunit)
MPQNPIDLTGAKILIVDDIPTNLNVLRQALETEGYNIIATLSGEVALNIAARTQPELILLDIMMPGIDGFETCRLLKTNENTADIPVIFISAKAETESIVKGFRGGGVDYITKPFQHDEVRVRVKTHLTIKRLRDGLMEANNQLESAYQQLETDNRRKTEELETARLIQQGFLPASVPEISFLEIATFQNPATEVGGDYYDFLLENSNSISATKSVGAKSPRHDMSSKLIVAIGDATGHGVGSSLMVSATKTALLTVNGSELAKRLSQINHLLKQLNSYRLLNMGLTLVELTYDENSGRVWAKATSAGMPPLYILRSDGNAEEIVIEGLPLGALETAEYTSTRFQLKQSDILILMSDGLPERLNDNGELFSYSRIRTGIKNVGKTASNAADILNALVKLGDDWSNGTPQNDDVTFVVLKVK